MENRVALIGIIVEDFSSTEKVNELLHSFRSYVIGRMGIPYDSRKVGIISVAVDAPSDKISALTGKIGMIKGVSCKTVYSNISGDK